MKPLDRALHCFNVFSNFLYHSWYFPLKTKTRKGLICISSRVWDIFKIYSLQWWRPNCSECAFCLFNKQALGRQVTFDLQKIFQNLEIGSFDAILRFSEYNYGSMLQQAKWNRLYFKVVPQSPMLSFWTICLTWKPCSKCRSKVLVFWGIQLQKGFYLSSNGITMQYHPWYNKYNIYFYIYTTHIFRTKTDIPRTYLERESIFCG